MKRRTPGSRALAVAIVLAAVVLAVMTIFLVVDERSRSAVPDTPSGESARSEQGLAGGAVHVANSPTNAARMDLRPELPSAPSGPESTGDGLRVRVIDGRTNATVEGARVMLLDQSPAAQIGRSPAAREGLDRRETLERFATAAVTDSDGIARFDWPHGPAAMSCEHAGLFAEQEIQRAPTAAIDLVLEPDEVFRVRVLDARGAAAAGVRVAWVEDLGGADVWPLASAVTRAPDGIAIFEHTQLARKQDELARTFVTPNLLLDETLLVPVDDERPSDGVLEIVLPELGSLECRIVDSEGKPPVGWCDLSVRISARRMKTMQAAGVRIVRFGLERRSLDPRFVFEHVGLGLELELLYRTELDAGNSRRMQGPREPGERMSVDLLLTTGEPSLLARILDVDGTPLSWHSVWLTFCDRNRQVDSAAPLRWHAFTDAEGLVGEPIHWASQQDSVFRLEIDAESASGRKRASARIDLPAPLPRAVLDLGDVSLELDPVIVAGRVVDEAGAPIAWAYVSAEPLRGPDSVVVGLESSPDPGANTHSDARGRFEVRSRRGAMRLRVQGRHEDYGVPNGVEAALGAHDVVLVLSSAGSIAGGALLDPGAWPMLYRLTMELTPQSSTQPRHSWQSDGAFQFSQIAPGTYDLTLRFAPENAELGHWSGLEVRANETLRDERLAAIDLRSSLRVLTIALTDPAGEPVHDGHIEYRKPGDLGAWLDFALPLGAGRHAVVTTHPELDMRITAPGFATQELARVSSDLNIELERGPAVRVVVGGALPRIGDQCHLGVFLRLQDLKSSVTGSAHAVLDVSGVACAHVSVAGTYAVILSLERDDGKHGLQTFNSFADQFFTVEEASIEQVLALPPLDSVWIERIELAAREDS